MVAQRQLSTHPHLTELKLLSGEALRHALERRSLWEHRTFASALIAEVENRKELRRRHELGIAFGEFRHIEANHVQSWFSERMVELISFITMAETLFNRDFREALGPEGDHGDPELVAFSARSIGRLYEEVIEWALRWRRTSCDEKWKNLANLMGHLVDDIIQQIEEVGPSIQATITEMDEAMARGEDPNRRIVLTLELPRAAEVQEELRRLAPTR